MPRYKLHAPHFINNAMHPAGAIIEYDGIPGTQLEPMDDEAWSRHHSHKTAMLKGRRGLPRYPFTSAARAAQTGPVEIPADWRSLKGLPLIHLARRLGAPLGTKANEARAFIAAEDEKRSGEVSHTPDETIKEGL